MPEPRIYFLFAFLLFFCAEGSARDRARWAPHFGARAGLNFSGATTGGSSSMRAGFIGGVLLEAPVQPDFFYLEPEFDFVQRGAVQGGPLHHTELDSGSAPGQD